jgi:hypothetical protein
MRRRAKERCELLIRKYIEKYPNADLKCERGHIVIHSYKKGRRYWYATVTPEYFERWFLQVTRTRSERE